MDFRLENTLTRTVEKLSQHKIDLYTCGPTVYDFAHIGNLRSYIFADSLRRALLFSGKEVRWVMNITDVDDKTIRRTIEEYGIHATPADLRTFTDKYFTAFRKNLAEVNIPEHEIEFIRVSDVIPQIITFIKELMTKGFAYATEDGVYFSIDKYQKEFADYGALVGKNFLEGKKTGARVKVDEYEKDNLSDFALWKAKDPADGNIFWTDPAGELPDGRPGWHIKCSVINRVAFGDNPATIHTGGVDLIFPHHTNEIAQSQPFYKPFVRHWAHCEHLMVNGRKMAKREGNFYTLEDLKTKIAVPGLAFRYLVLQTNYRSQMNFLIDSLMGAAQAVARLNAHAADETDPKTEEKVRTALADDLNTAQAVAATLESPSKSLVEVLGLTLKLPSEMRPLKLSELPQNIADLYHQRSAARKNKNFSDSDALRDRLDSLGYKVLDTPDGQQIWKK